MLAFMRFILKLRDREHILRTNYHRDHPHYPLYLVIDALLSAALVFGAVQVGSSMAGASQAELNLEHIGGHAFTASELVSTVQKSDTAEAHGYWLGAFNGDTYTTNYATAGALTISYLRPGQKVEAGLEPLMKITTYDSQDSYAAGLHGVTNHMNTTTENIRGDLLIYDANKMNILTISRAQSEEIVIINYSDYQNLNSMIQDSEYLRALN